MELQDKIALTKQNIYQALADYDAHVDKYNIQMADEVSSDFVERLARDSVAAKQNLREMLRKSPVWDEKLDALVINGTRTHDPNYDRIYSLAYNILIPARNRMDAVGRALLEDAINFFAEPFQPEDIFQTYIDAIKKLAPRAYAPNKKPSRVFKALCDALGVWDDTAGSEFQHKYAQLADEMSSKKINFKLFVSINPAHFITMSNPKHDTRGNTLTSCHSFNSTEYQYNNGCSGYARDDVTMIAFTAANPSDPETLNNRKTTRQLYMYKPGNGVLLQSRMYNTSGGTSGAQAETKLYRDLIQREISACEGAPNLWVTKSYASSCITLEPARGFGGYPDWHYADFASNLSVRKDHMDDYGEFKIGAAGLCICCGDTCSEGLYCCDCKDENCTSCDDCGDYFDDEDDLYTVYDEHGDERHVCQSCRDNNYFYCCECEEYHSHEVQTELANGDYVCDSCRERHYKYCEECGRWYHEDDVYRAVDAEGDEIWICEDCRDNYYLECEECEEYVRSDVAVEVIKDGVPAMVCPACRDGQYEECEKCGKYTDDIEHGMCEECREDEQEEEAV